MDWKMNSDLYKAEFDYKIAQFYGSLGIETVEQLKAHPEYSSYGIFDDEDDVVFEMQEDWREFNEEVVHGEWSDYDGKFYPDLFETGWENGIGFGNFGVDAQYNSDINDDGTLSYWCYWRVGFVECGHWTNAYSLNECEDSFEIDIHDPDIRTKIENELCKGFVEILKLCKEGYFDDWK